MRKFKKRRQRAGFALLASFAIIVLAVTLFLRTEPFGGASETASVERIAVPMISGAPEAVPEDAGQPAADTAEASGPPMAHRAEETRAAVAARARRRSSKPR